MRIILAASFASVLAACGPSTAAPGSMADTTLITAPAEETNFVAVLSYASWCGSCKTLDPNVEAVREDNTFDGVEFFALDYSEKDDAAFFADADTLGVGDTLRTKFSGGIKTGRLYLIDRTSGEIVAEISKDM
ncbi:unnamed protein product, partial [Chrysoparadoxa australica]